MGDPFTFVVFLLAAGFILVCLEVFVPGGILGTVGGVLLIAGLAISFSRPELRSKAPYLLLLVVLGCTAAMVAWVRLFPRSPVGRRMSLRATAEGFAASEEGLAELVGHAGVTCTTLRPSGMAEIDARRVDVVTEGDMIRKGEPVVVVQVEGNRVVVRRAAD